MPLGGWNCGMGATGPENCSFALGCPVATAIMAQATHVDRPCGFHHYGLI